MIEAVPKGKKFTILDENIVATLTAFQYLSSPGLLRSVIPIVAGTIGPVANAFNLCALVQPWRSEIPPGRTEVEGENISDPSWYGGQNLSLNGVALTMENKLG